MSFIYFENIKIRSEIKIDKLEINFIFQLLYRINKILNLTMFTLF